MNRFVGIFISGVDSGVQSLEGIAFRTVVKRSGLKDGNDLNKAAGVWENRSVPPIDRAGIVADFHYLPYVITAAAISDQTMEGRLER